jgi:membrane protease subunit HflK
MTNASSIRGLDKRGEWVALLGAAVSLVFAVLLGLLGIYSGNTMTATWGAAFLMAGCFGVWLLCYIQLHQQRLLEEERIEVAELERQRQEKLGGARTIFEDEELDQMETLAMGRRLRTVERILIPCVALVIAAFHLAAGLSIFEWFYQFPPITEAVALSERISFEDLSQARVVLFSTGAFSFFAFMLSRFALGLSQERRWGALKAGGNYQFGSSAVCLGISLVLLCEISGLSGAEIWFGQAIGILLMVLAVETAANFILDFYRPRVGDGFHRPFYDSRILGIFSEPGGILRSLANAIDYQFGFKVSETWFYKLLGRSVRLLLLVQAAVLLALTCIVVVPPGHQAVIEHLGRPAAKTAKPGIHLTWCWPIDRATIIPVERIQRMVLGHAAEAGEEGDDHGDVMEKRPPILWTKAHRRKEYKLLVADRRVSAETKVPVNLLSIEMPVQWRVKHGRDADVIRYYSQSADVASIIECLAYRELTRYAASADIEDFLGAGGIAAAAILHERVQQACDRAGYDGKGLGVEIVYLGIGGVHPPHDEDVAKTYEAVVSEIEKKDAAIQAAEGKAAALRIASGGMAWEQLHTAIVAEDAARQSDAADLAEKTARVEALLRKAAGGLARESAAAADQIAYARFFGEKAAAERYAYQLEAYEAGRGAYTLRLYARMLSEAMPGVRKYVILMDDPSKVIYELSLKPPSAMDTIAAEAGMQN